MAEASTQPAEEARANLEAGDTLRALEIALAALGEPPGDPALLRLAGRACLELGRDDAVSYLERAAALDPDDAEALVDLGHVHYAAGRTEQAIATLRQASERDPDGIGALRGLVEVYRREGRLEEALEAAGRVADARPEDVGAALDVADLSLSLGRFDDAVGAFGRLRALDDDPEHDVYAYHGLIEVEVRRKRWRRALDLAVDATRVDRLGRTTDVLAGIVAVVFGESDRPSPEPVEIEDALARSRAEHRRLHAGSY